MMTSDIARVAANRIRHLSSELHVTIITAEMTFPAVRQQYYQETR